MNKISIKDSTLAFIFASLLSQVFVGVFLVFAFAICLSFGLNINLDWFANNCWGYLLCAIALNFSLFLNFFYFKRKKEDKIIKKPEIKKILTYILIAVIAFFMLYPAINLIEILLTNIGVKQADPPILKTTTDFIVSIVSMALLPAIFEELVFRGIIFSGLKQKGKSFAILISALMFSLFHLSIHQTIYPFVMGMLFGCIMFKENNILYTIITHFVCNLLSLIHSYFGLWFISTHWLYIVVAILLFVAFLTFVLVYAIRSNKEQKEKLTKNDKIYLSFALGIVSILWIIINFVNFL